MCPIVTFAICAVFETSRARNVGWSDHDMQNNVGLQGTSKKRVCHGPVFKLYFLDKSIIEGSILMVVLVPRWSLRLQKKDANSRKVEGNGRNNG